jgi:hypothetical protein
MMIHRLRNLLLAAAIAACASASGAARGGELRWTFQFDHIFAGGTKPLLIYARENDGQWITGVGSSRDPSRPGVKKTYNRSWYYADMAAVPIKDGRMQGVIKLHMTPDLWVPLDHQGYAIDLRIDATRQGADKITGKFEILSINSNDASVKDFGRKGTVSATAQPKEQADLPEPMTLTCNMQGSMIGGEPTTGDRCMILSLGIKEGRLISTAHASMSKKHTASGRQGFTAVGNTVTAERDRFTAHIAVPAKTLDMEPCTYVFDIDGHMFDQHLVGTYDLTVKIDGRDDIALAGSFDGVVEPGVVRYDVETDVRPWFVPVKGHKAVQPGEHPRLLFRKSDLPALRKKAQTPGGKAIVARLRRTLDGANGDSMPVAYNPTRGHVGPDGSGDFIKTAPLGSYTFSHVAGYGLLYQLTGEKKYAELGRQCFEKALEGVRDTDRRYSFKHPRGTLRAGPVLGWMAVGFDLCHDAWDKKTRENLGRTIAEYKGELGDKVCTLETLARGSMPPESNHFGMQVGGATMALLAVTGEPWVDQDRIDRLTLIARESMIRNANEGFGDGGHFAEGDGTGSMSSHIIYVSAIQALKNADGLDFIDVARPNVRMMSLKWIYQTVIRDGRPDFWPIRGAYGHNVWARDGYGKSGAGYVAIGLGGVTESDRAAMKWFYNRYLLEADTERDAPFDTVSRYPHLSVCALVNWPLDVKERNPGAVLPHCYRDSKAGFYLWRNRWQDDDDTVITVLTNRTAGYMKSSSDRALKLNSMGRHFSWGTVKDGPTRHWSTSPRGQTSSLTLSDGTCFGVDFSKASGADVMLVTTGAAEGQSVKVGGKTLTFAFPTVEAAPKVGIKGDAAVVGKQRVTIEDGNLVFGMCGSPAYP